MTKLIQISNLQYYMFLILMFATLSSSYFITNFSFHEYLTFKNIELFEMAFTALQKKDDK